MEKEMYIQSQIDCLIHILIISSFELNSLVALSNLKNAKPFFPDLFLVELWHKHNIPFHYSIVL